MEAKLPVTLVIPAYNEAARIGEVLKSVRSLVEEVVVVDDGSGDDTSRIAADAGVTVLRHVTNRGQGAALRTGTKYALSRTAGIVVHFDADGQFRPADIAAVSAPLLAGKADIVFGSRFLDGETVMPAFKKHLIMPLARFFNRFFFGISLTDPQSGFRAFTKLAGGQLAWQQDGMAHCTEILFLAHRRNLRIVEVPITVIYHEFGQKLSGGLKIIKDLFMARLLN